MKKIKVILVLVILTLLLQSCTKTKYLVLFDTNGGNTIDNVYVLEGEKLAKPTDPIKEGFTFLYWMFEGEKFDFETPINNNMALVAKWEEETFYQVIIDTNGAGANQTINVKNGEKLSKPNDPEKAGYLFVEWQLDGEPYDFSKEVTSNFTLKALWEEIVYTPNVSVSSVAIISNDYPNGDEGEYYLDRDEDFQIVINLINHDEKTIETVKINNVVYNKNQFLEDSTSNKIIIGLNTKNNIGKNLLILEEVEIAELEGNEVLIVEDMTVLFYVKARFNPVIYFEDEIPGYDSYQIILDLVDRNVLIDYNANDVVFYLYEDEIEIHQEAINIDINTIVLEDLKIDHAYTYKVVAKYDFYDGLGKITKVLYESSFETLAPFEVKVFGDYETKISFKLKMAHNVTLISIGLYKENTKVADLDLNDTLVENLDPATYYLFVFDYKYINKNNEITHTQIFGAQTYKLVLEDVIRNGRVVKHPDGSPVQIPIYRKKTEEVRGIWVSTVSNIDLPKMQGTNIEGYKDTIRVMFDNIQNANFNTIFFQIRPMNDAFYPSALAPWSRYITGIEGKSPEFDLLEFAIEEAHLRGLELHGWLNPYRVATNQGMLSGMANNNFAKMNPELLLTNADGAVILDPGKPEVQTYIRDVISEIITNYPTINGIHFDDYFYLSNFGENTNSPDYQTYITYRTGSGQSIADFRRMSVTNMIRGIYEDVEDFNNENNTYIKFGISPSGVWANKGTHPEGSSTAGYQHYSQLYADTRAWIQEGIIHYIIPQIYWDFTLSAAPYGHLVDWWSETVRGTDVVLLIGMGPYRYRESAWYTYELAEQLRYNQNHPEVKGQVYFTYQDIVSTSYPKLVTVRNYIADNFWTEKAKVPWETNIE